MFSDRPLACWCFFLLFWTSSDLTSAVAGFLLSSTRLGWEGKSQRPSLSIESINTTVPLKNFQLSIPPAPDATAEHQCTIQLVRHVRTPTSPLCEFEADKLRRSLVTHGEDLHMLPTSPLVLQNAVQSSTGRQSCSTILRPATAHNMTVYL